MEISRKHIVSDDWTDDTLMHGERHAKHIASSAYYVGGRGLKIMETKANKIESQIHSS